MYALCIVKNGTCRGYLWKSLIYKLVEAGRGAGEEPLHACLGFTVFPVQLLLVTAAVWALSRII